VNRDRWIRLRAATGGESVMANFKAAGCNRFLQFVVRLLANQRVKLPLCDAIEKRAHLIFFSINLKFYAPIRQIADPACYIKTCGGVTHGPAKPDALNVSLIENLERSHDQPVMSGGVEIFRCEAAKLTITDPSTPLR